MQEVKKHELLITHQPSGKCLPIILATKWESFPWIKLHNQLTLLNLLLGLSPRKHWAPETGMAAETQWENPSTVREHFIWIYAMEPCIREDKLAAVVHSFMGDEMAPFSLSRKMASYVYNHLNIKRKSPVWKHRMIWKIKAGVVRLCPLLVMPGCRASLCALCEWLLSNPRTTNP